MHIPSPGAKVEEDVVCPPELVNIIFLKLRLWEFHILLVWRISESFSGMKDGQIICVLNVSLLEVQPNAMLLAQKVQGIQCLCLCFSDWRDVGGSWLCQKSSKCSSSILHYKSLWRLGSCGLVMKEGPQSVGCCRVSKPMESSTPLDSSVNSPNQNQTYPSTTQSEVKV